MSVDLAAVYAVGLACPLGGSFALAMKAYRAGERVFVKSADGPIGPDGMAITLAAVIPFAEMHNYELRLQRLFEAAANDLTAALPQGLGAAPLRLVVPAWLIGSPIGERLAIWIVEAFPSLVATVEFMSGESSLALWEIARSLQTIADGGAPALIVGALDSLLHAEHLDRLANENRLMLRGNPHGVIPGEAAALFFLSSPAAMGDVTPLGAVTAAYRGQEVEDVDAPAGIIGRGLAAPFRTAFEEQTPGRLIVDLNGERWRSEDIGFALGGASGIPDDLLTDFETPLGFAGDCGAASGAILVAVALASPPESGHGAAVPKLAAVSTAARSGLRCVAIIERYADQDAARRK